MLLLRTYTTLHSPYRALKGQSHQKSCESNLYSRALPKSSTQLAEQPSNMSS